MPVLDLEPRAFVAHEAPLQAAIDQISRLGGGLLRLLPGVHETGSIRLRSGVGIEIAPGAVWQACADPAAFPPHQSSVSSRMDIVPWRAFIFADSAQDLSLFGGGRIEGGGQHECFLGRFDNDPNRPYGLHFIDCEGVRVSDLKLRNSAFWMQRYLGCRNVFLRGLDVYNHCNQNNDGLDIDSSRDVVVSDCVIDASDDAICLKSEGAAPAQNIVIRNCIAATHASGIKLGSGSVGGFRNISISGIVLRRSTSPTMWHPLKHWGGLTGIDIASIDGGALDAVSVSDVIMEGYVCPLILRQGRRLSGSVVRQGYATGGDARQGINQDQRTFSPGLPVFESKVFRNVSISGIKARELGPYPIIVSGCPEAPLGQVALNDILLEHRMSPTRDAETALPDEIDDTVYTGPDMWRTGFPCHGVFAREAPQLTCRNVISLPAVGDLRAEFWGTRSG